MKKIIFLIGLLCMSIGTTLKAQDDDAFHKVEFGFRFMPTLSSVSMETSSGGTIKGEATLGWGFGALLGLNFTNHIGLEADLLYNSVSQKYVDAGLDRVMNVRYLTIPLLISLSTGKSNPVNLHAEIGPEIGINIASSVKSSNDTLITVLTTKQSDFGLAYGAGLGFTLNEDKTIRFDLGYRGIYGRKVKTNSAYVGFTFLF